MEAGKYWDIFIGSFSDYWNYLIGEITNPHWNNYFYWLIGISLFFYSLELIIPWRKDQPRIRKDFWLDGFYMFVNFFLFSLVGFFAISNVVVELFNDGLRAIGITNGIAITIAALPGAVTLLLAFLFRDFLQWNVHRLLHRVPFLWEFHKVHHSVKQMGFAAHLRYHWMENVVYKSLLYIPMAMVGFGIEEFFAAHIIGLAIGHFNHSNINVPLGPFKYILNNPQMHIWHHARQIPGKYRYGVNFGISLSLWDYLFNTDYIPHSGRDAELGFYGDEDFPKDFIRQEIYPLGKRKVEAPASPGVTPERSAQN